MSAPVLSFRLGKKLVKRRNFSGIRQQILRTHRVFSKNPLPSIFAFLFSSTNKQNISPLPPKPNRRFKEKNWRWGWTVYWTNRVANLPARWLTDGIGLSKAPLHLFAFCFRVTEMWLKSFCLCWGRLSILKHLANRLSTFYLMRMPKTRRQPDKQFNWLRLSQIECYIGVEFLSLWRMIR